MSETTFEADSARISSIYKCQTKNNADSVEWCPHTPYHNHFVCGNYQLEQTDESDGNQKRYGKILFYSITQTDGLSLIQTINTEAVLDQKWCPNRIDGSILLGVATAKSHLLIYQLVDGELGLVCDWSFGADDCLILSLDWSTDKVKCDQPEIVCSDSNGYIHRLVYEDRGLRLKKSWHAHEFEAWISAYDYWDANVVYTGGDDALFCKFDGRCGDAPVASNRVHEAGVTSIHSNIAKEYTVATGSYDSHVRIWDSRKFKQPISKIKMPGTIWRLKWDPFQHNHLLAVCMLGGIHILDCTTLGNPKITESFYEHDNLCYGADWSHLKGDNTIIGSCSFYNNLLCISKLNCNIIQS